MSNYVPDCHSPPACMCVCACINLIPLGPLSIIREQSSCMNIKRLLPVVYATELIINEV